MPAPPNCPRNRNHCNCQIISYKLIVKDPPDSLTKISTDLDIPYQTSSLKIRLPRQSLHAEEPLNMIDSVHYPIPVTKKDLYEKKITEKAAQKISEE